MDLEIVRANIDAQEHKDAFVTACLVRDLLKDRVEDLLFLEMPRFTHYDLVASFTYKGKQIKMAFEIKERNKTEYLLKYYPNSELKAVKYNYIMEATKDFDFVYYVQLVNKECAHTYNLRKLDWSLIETKRWEIKKTLYNPDSGYENPIVHFIPYSCGNTHHGLLKYYDEYEELNK